MDVFDAIYARRSIGKVKEEDIPREYIEKILEAGTWAPNHFRTESWQFVVFQGEGRRALGKLFAQIVLANKDGISNEEKREISDKQLSLAFRAPVIITVVVRPSDKPGVLREEELAAGHAAVQNMLLASHALGLGAIWRTGMYAYREETREFFNLREEDAVVGFIYIGYLDMKIPSAKRVPWEDKTKWIEDK